MDLSFQEKSTLGSLIAILGTSCWYFHSVVASGPGIGAGHLAGLAIGAVVIVVVIEIAYHTVIAARTQVDEEDERDRLVKARATRLSAVALQVGVFTAICQIVAGGLVSAGDTSFPALFTPFATAHILVATIVMAETLDLSLQLFYYRRGV